MKTADQILKELDECENPVTVSSLKSIAISKLKQERDALIGGIEKEREACAVTAWTKGMELHHPVNEPRAREVGSECAKAIRARGNE